MNVKKKVKEILKKIPFLSKILRILRAKINIKITIPKKNVKGANNVFDIDKSAHFLKSTFDIVGNKNIIEINESSYFSNVTFFIRGSNNKIKIGKNVRFNSGGSIWIEDYGCEIVIGDNSTFEDSHIAVTEPNSKIHIGKDCMFAYDIDIRTGDSHSIIDCLTNERINYAKNIDIGNHIWVSSHVSILKGVHIADNSVIATRAVVTKSFIDTNILIGGIPAKKLKDNIKWDRQRIYK